MKTIGFFNPKGGVGKTTLVQNIAWMLSEMGIAVIAADFDPQPNLSSAFLPSDRLEEIWASPTAATVAGGARPLVEGTGDIAAPRVERIDANIALLVGDLKLARLEEMLGEAWRKCLSGDIEAFKVTSAFHRLILLAGQETGAELALVDVGPSLGAINRAALLACDYVVIPLGADFFSLPALQLVGSELRKWRAEWTDRLDRSPSIAADMPTGSMTPVGYVVMRHSVRMDRPASAVGEWMGRIPAAYSQLVLGQEALPVDIRSDPNCLALLKDFRSLVPLAQEVWKPLFLLKPADGAFGGHQQAVSDSHRAFHDLTVNLLRHCGIDPGLL
jgi:chromosome partitioning protein